MERPNGSPRIAERMLRASRDYLGYRQSPRNRPTRATGRPGARAFKRSGVSRPERVKTPESGRSSCGSRRGKCWHLCVDAVLHYLTSKLDCAAASMHVGGCLAGRSCEDIPSVPARKVCGAADHVCAPSWLRTAGVALCTHRLCTWRYSMT